MIYEERGIDAYKEKSSSQHLPVLDEEEARRRKVRDNLIVRYGITNLVLPVIGMYTMIPAACLLFFVSFVSLVWERLGENLHGSGEYGLTIKCALFGLLFITLGLTSIFQIRTGLSTYARRLTEGVTARFIATAAISFLSICLWIVAAFVIFPGAFQNEEGITFMILFLSILCLPHLGIIVMNAFAVGYIRDNREYLLEDAEEIVEWD